MYEYILNNFSTSVSFTDEQILHKAKEKYPFLKDFPCHLYRKSVDARNKNDIQFVCSIQICTEEPLQPIFIKKNKLTELEHYVFQRSNVLINLTKRPLIVGAGPAGLFAAYILAMNGFNPILIERGADIEERASIVNNFFQNGILDTETNIQFGAGGAGTFSDGKLMTRINDPRCSFVLKTFVEMGAPKEILTLAKPHIGTDILRVVISNMIDKIKNSGGEVHFHTKMLDFQRQNDGTYSVLTNKGSFCAGLIVLAIGNAARDTFIHLLDKDFSIIPKPISVGVRIEHNQNRMDECLYGKFAGHPNLKHAEYALSDTNNKRGVYTFCMCPGGEVVAAASEEEGVVVNGMSNFKRDGENANSAIAVSIFPEDITGNEKEKILGMINFQRKIEKNAYLAGGSDYTAPIMTVRGLMEGKQWNQLGSVKPTYRNGKVKFADFETIFPSCVVDGLKRGISSFGRKIFEFQNSEAILTAPETRTSSPIRIQRNMDTMEALFQPGIYPCGEGAGYAGGITSASVDGIRVAETILNKYKLN